MFVQFYFVAGPDFHRDFSVIIEFLVPSLVHSWKLSSRVTTASTLKHSAEYLTILGNLK